MAAFSKEPACDRIDLDVLLFGDEASDEFRKSQCHVETCPHCQDRLAKTAADDRQWAEVRSVLQTNGDECLDELDYTVDEPRSSGGSTPILRGARPIKLDFLSPGAHPELLGQLGRYQIEHVIGAGGMGIVLKGFDTNLNRPVAIKVLAPHLAHNGAARQRFAREARAAAAVVHEHIVAIYNVESEQETPFIVMQYVPGRSLQDRVDQGGPLTAEEISRIGMQAAAGLSAAHAQGVIHRDVKPGNILLENGVERVLLTDFGLARAADDASLTHSGIVAGTPHYMSPEQASGEATDGRSDLFSLGAVLYFMATGHPPFRAEQAMAVLNRICRDRHRPVRDVNPHVPYELADVIDRLLEKRPSRRFASAEDVRQALADVLKSLQSPRPWRRRRRVMRELSRHRTPAIAACLLIGLASLAWTARSSLLPIRHDAAGSEASIGGDAATVKPRSDVPATPAAPFLSAETLALMMATGRPEFDDEVSDIAKELKAAEADSSSQRTSIENPHRTWSKEFRAVLEQIRRIEASFPDGLSTGGSPSK
jgi:eukaryotic-like serine/threonine-protein kinase